MDERLSEALEPVLRDLRSTGVPVPRIEDRDWTQDPGAPSVMLWSADGSGTGIYATLSVEPPQRVAEVADRVQEWIVEELQAAGRTNWPPCPAHPTTHPLAAGVEGDEAVWSCPVDGTVVARVGAFGDTPGGAAGRH